MKAKDSDQKSDSDFVCVKTYLKMYEADIARGVLETNGIVCIIQSDDCGGERLSMGFATGVKLMVREIDANKAVKLLGEAS